MSDVGLAYQEAKIQFDTEQCHASVGYVVTGVLTSIPAVVATASLQDNAQKAVTFLENKLSLDLSETARNVLEMTLPCAPLVLFAGSMALFARYLQKKVQAKKAALQTV